MRDYHAIVVLQLNLPIFLVGSLHEGSLGETLGSLANIMMSPP